MIQYNAGFWGAVAQKTAFFDNFHIYGGVIDSTGICYGPEASIGWPGQLK